MTMPSLIWGSPQWVTSVLVILAVAAAAILWSYGWARSNRPVRIAAATLKAVGFTALAFSLLDPLLSGSRPRRGANAFVILADNSQSLGIQDDNATATRGEWLRGRYGRNRPGGHVSGRILTCAATCSTRISAASTDSRP